MKRPLRAPADLPDLDTDPTYVCRLIREQLGPKVLRYGPDDPANMEDGTAE